MEIEANLAQLIVDSMKEIIHQDLNFFSLEGTIIASTNRERIGSTHEGAKKVIHTKRSVTIENDEDYPGAKKGMNIPIFLESNLVGVIGITGDKKEVEQYGKIIKQMTEILIKENLIRTITYNKRNNYRLLIDELLLNKNPREDVIYSLANILDLKIETSRIVVIGKISQGESNHVDDVEIEQVYSIIDAALASNKQNFFTIDSQFVHIVFELNTTQNFNTVLFILKNLIKRIMRETKSQIIFGIGIEGNTISTMQESYRNAYQALRWSVMFSGKEIEIFDEINFGQILLNVPSESAKQFVQDIFKDMSDKQIDNYLEIITVYQECNGSIYKSAEKLFIHKNTLQYQLNKLHNLTGYDPRNLKDHFVLSLAFHLYKLNQKKSKKEENEE